MVFLAEESWVGTFLIFSMLIRFTRGYDTIDSGHLEEVKGCCAFSFGYRSTKTLPLAQKRQYT
jgi:hypothetical protein